MDDAGWTGRQYLPCLPEQVYQVFPEGGETKSTQESGRPLTGRFNPPMAKHL